LARLFSGHKALSDYVFLLIILLLAVSGLMEFYGMVQKLNYACYAKLGVCGGVLMILFTFVCISGQFGRPVTPSRMNDRETMFIILFVLGLCVRQFMSRRVATGIIAISTTLFGLMYVPWLLNFIQKINFFGQAGVEGEYYVLYFVLVTKFSDCGAYAVGSLIGRHKMIPRISPGKTWEGFGGAVVVSTAASVLFARLAGSHLAGMTLAHSIILGIILSIAAVVGDLIESLFKREAGLKDSGHFSRHRRHFGFIGQPAVQRADHVSVSAPCVDVSSAVKVFTGRLVASRDLLPLARKRKGFYRYVP
jgi:phosphatidate cytidylyltransferase